MRFVLLTGLSTQARASGWGLSHSRELSPFLPCSSLECISVFSLFSTLAPVVLMATLETTEVQQMARFTEGDAALRQR